MGLFLFVFFCLGVVMKLVCRGKFEDIKYVGRFVFVLFVIGFGDFYIKE